MSEEPVMKIFNLAEVPRVRSDGFVSAYCNHTEAAPGFYEITFTFADIARGVDGSPIVQQHAVISMTWEHATRVKELLDRQIEAYETENGKIRKMKEVAPEQAPKAPDAQPNLSQP